MEKTYFTQSQKHCPPKKDPAMLKNIRQIGMPSSGYKLYIEDSVLSYLKRQMKKEDSRVIALVGSEAFLEETNFIFVEGAICADDIFVNGKNLSFGKKAFTNLYEDMNTFFDDCSLLGWYVPMYEMIRTYGSTLGEKCKLFVLDDPTTQGEMFYIKEMNRIKKLSGYNIFYEKNEPMKSYLISCKETMEAAGIQAEEREIKEPEPKKEPLKLNAGTKKEKITENEKENSKFTPFLYAASCVLAIVILVVGITMMSNNDKIQEIQKSLETLAQSVAGSLTDNTDQMVDDTAAPTEALEEQTPEETENTEGQAVANEEVEVSSNHVDVVEYYVVKEGDTLAGISMKLYESVNMVEKICEINSIEDEDSLYIGQKIYLPDEQE